jgi:uncharacterized protein YqhQ
MALCSMIFGHGRTSHPREILFESIIHTFIVLGYIHQVQVKFSSLTSLRFSYHSANTEWSRNYKQWLFCSIA